MPSDFRTLLWLLKLGAGVNVYFFASLLAIATPNPHVVVPGLILVGFFLQWKPLGLQTCLDLRHS